jgi:hypothetical protein
MEKYFVFFAFFLFVGCSSQTSVIVDQPINIPSNSVSQPTKATNEKPLEKLKLPAKQIKIMPVVKDFGIFNLIRNSDKKDETGLYLPPFSEARIEIALNQAPKVGDKVTVVPLSVKFEPFQLSIVKTGEKKEEPCNAGKPKFYWDVELERITDKAILEFESVENNQEFPFEVIGIYPSVEFARSIPQTELTIEMIPKDIAVQTVKGAVDLDNDGKPDLLEVRFCCEKPSEIWNENNDCYSCQKSFKKINGAWKLVNSAQPC